jgi:alkylation response protein AidB-like acyl-CoA dehydrogenase
MSLFLVDMNSPGVSVSRTLKKMGMHASDTAEITFDDVRVPDENLLGEEGMGFYHISWELQGERLVGAVMAVAGAERVLEKTIQYAYSRQAFGRPVAEFQSIRHKLAQMATQIEAAKQLTYATAWRFQNGEYAVREATMAKLFATQAACEIADQCIQIHGGYGYMQEYGIERAYRDMRLYRIGGGTDEIMLDVIGRSMTPGR